ncbi:MAG: nucleotidyltransferase domain-containing protein [Oceanospirillaceae bacterium]|nr:nucleotidyltransferase domain-containing protein [Colwellia sp.]NQZ32133.1 nucleotidyltransferase domain-containing protein [Oceanospirillaceae bacterium]
MRISKQDALFIKNSIVEQTNAAVKIWLFGSRVNDDEKGGDVDLLVKLDVAVERPALLASGIAVKIMRQMHGRKVDVVLEAPNLDAKPIHAIAKQMGIEL